jgi:zona occludens toxin
MIYLFTGINGASKTLNAIKFVNEDEAFKDRPVYYFNIDSLQLPWTELTLDEVCKWWELPPGSVIFVDECYKIFPARKAGAPVPEHIQRLAEHRKDGYDFIFVCQKVVGQVDAFARGLVGRHVHLERIFNSNRIRWYEWQKCIDDVNDYHQRKEAIKKTVKIDKAYFAAYKSAQIHTMKPNVPWLRLAGFAALVLFVVGLFASFAFRMSSRISPDDSKVAFEASSASGLGLLPFGNGGNKAMTPLTVEQYLAAHKPRIEGFPHTAPIYDELTKPKTYPRLNCVMWISGPQMGDCVCYTQQATKAAVPVNVCADIVKNGYFDYAREESGAQGREAQASVAPAPGLRASTVY